MVVAVAMRRTITMTQLQVVVVAAAQIQMEEQSMDNTPMLTTIAEEVAVVQWSEINLAVL
jgi:hypothetical protein